MFAIIIRVKTHFSLQLQNKRWFFDVCKFRQIEYNWILEFQLFMYISCAVTCLSIIHVRTVTYEVNNIQLSDIILIWPAVKSDQYLHDLFISNHARMANFSTNYVFCKIDSKMRLKSTFNFLSVIEVHAHCKYASFYIPNLYSMP